MKPFSWSRYLLFGILFLAVGGTLGWLSRPRLNTNPQLNATQRSTPREQFADAMLIGNSEDAWKALRVFHPTSQERWRAEERLAIQYLNQGRLDEARLIFETFIEQASDDKFNLVPVGFAGRAVIAALQNNYQASDQILADNAQRLSQKLDGPMKPLVRETILQNEKHLENPRMTIAKMFPEEAAEG